MEKDTNKKAKWVWRPRSMSLFYMCEDQEIHELTGIVWGTRLWRRKDRSLFPIQAIAPYVYGFGRSGEAEGPVAEDGKPVLQ